MIFPDGFETSVRKRAGDKDWKMCGGIGVDGSLFWGFGVSGVAIGVALPFSSLEREYLEVHGQL